MIIKLKKKFIVINMVLAAFVLNISFFFIAASTYQRLSVESMQALEQSFVKIVPSEPSGNNPAVPPKDNSLLMEALTFNVKLSDNQQTMTLIGDNIDYDDATLHKIVNSCLEQAKPSGILIDYHLRYLVRKSTYATEIAFYDLTNDIHTMTTLVKNLIFVEIGALAAFFLISLFLSRWALKPLELSWNQQKQFIADASHELKTPLTVILANTDILTSHSTDTIQNQIKWLEYIQVEATHMHKLVNDLLFLANADAFREKPVFSKVNLSDAVWNCYLPFETVVFEQGKILNCNIESEIYISADESKLKQLILILLDNACKYTDNNGQIIVSLTQKQEKAYFTVTNEGAPIASEHLPHLFERFYRADESRTRETGGYGLGLSIAKAITDMLQGKISVTSNTEVGTTFIVIFPMNK
ncbi:MAG TPA: HAMP domain-containing sensor histidine kinase [Mobilitalea sp.]|nr:HAMP domain-containing sensor histidine kinase [Mobilitalea sp.]